MSRPRHIEESLSPDELAARYLARFDWRRSRSSEPKPPSRVLSYWEAWIGSDPERAWPLFEALVRLRPDDDEVLEQVWYRLTQLLARHGRAFEPRVRALVEGNTRLRRVAPAAELSSAAHRPRPLDVEALVRAYIHMSVHFEPAHEVRNAVREDPEHGVRLALEIIARGPLYGFGSFDTFSPLRDVLRDHGDAVIDAVEEAAAESVLVRRCLWRMQRQQSHPPERYDIPGHIWARLERATGGTTDYDSDDPPGNASTVSLEDERAIEGWFQYEDSFWAFDRVGDIVRSDPELAWRVIRLLVDAAPSPEVLGAIAAGPLEDFLSAHGSHFIDRVEGLARGDDPFRECLGGVWQSGMSDELWARVQAAAEG